MFWMAQQVLIPTGVGNHGEDHAHNQVGSNDDHDGSLDEIVSFRTTISKRILHECMSQLRYLFLSLENGSRFRSSRERFPELPYLGEKKTMVIPNVGDDYAFCGTFEPFLPIKPAKMSTFGVRRMGDHGEDSNWMIRREREARNDEQELGSGKIVCQDSGDELWVLKSLTKSSSANGKRLRAQPFSIKQFLLKLSTNYDPSPHTGSSNLCKNLNILPSVNRVKNGESCAAIGIDSNFGDKVTAELLNYSTDCNPNKREKTAPKDDDNFNQNKRKETAQCVSSFLIFAIPCLWILLMTFNRAMYRNHLVTMIIIQSLHREQGPVSKVVPLIGLFGFMAFVWAIATMILVGAKFTRIHTAMFLSCAILMHVMPDNPINVMYLPILGIFVMGWYGKAAKKGEKLSSSSFIPEYVMPQL